MGLSHLRASPPCHRKSLRRGRVLSQPLTCVLPTSLKMMAISPSLDTFGLRDLGVYFCARANVALTAPP